MSETTSSSSDPSSLELSDAAKRKGREHQSEAAGPSLVPRPVSVDSARVELKAADDKKRRRDSSTSSSSDESERERKRRSKKLKRKEKKKEKSKHKKEKEKRKKRDKADGPVQLSKFLGKGESSGKYSAISGKKIKLKVDKSKADKIAERERKHMLAVLNATLGSE